MLGGEGEGEVCVACGGGRRLGARASLILRRYTQSTGPVTLHNTPPRPRVVAIDWGYGSCLGPVRWF